MQESNIGLLIVVGFVALLLGGFGGFLFAPDKEVVKTVPGPERIIEKEVIKEVPIEVIKEVSTGNYIKQATDLLMNKLEKDDDFDNYLKCDGERYEFDQVSVSKVYDDATVSFDKVDTDDLDDADKYTVETKIRLKYKDTDVEEKCYETVDLKAEFEEGENPELTLS